MGFPPGGCWGGGYTPSRARSQTRLASAYYDIAIGGRGALWRDTVFAFASMVVPLNDGVVRTDPIPLVGIEATF
jgi:hypothetical protein